jgi:drug/metabolite transporter (DMT)-like permease
MQPESRGLGYGFLGVAIFSLTLPATRLAVAALDPSFVGLGRAVIAAILAGLLLWIRDEPLPDRRLWPSFLIVVAGVIIGFPLLSAIALRDSTASHGAVIIGLVPLATALAGVWRAGERPSRGFWGFALLGSSLVVGFALLSGAGTLRPSDWALLGAAAAAGIGYAEGGVLARKVGAWQTICWALVMALPIVTPIAFEHRPAGFATVPLTAWLGFGYVSVFSMFLGFFAWYHGLALGGIARVGQMQLLQPFLTLTVAAIALGEPITGVTIVFAMGVVCCVALGKRTQVVRG